MNKERNDISIFQKPLWVSVFALTAAIVWGWANPLIKLGFEEFQITADMTGSKMLFAGIRFCVSGLIILAMARQAHRPFEVQSNKDWWYILLFSLFSDSATKAMAASNACVYLPGFA